MKTDPFYILSFKVVPIGFYTFFQRFGNCFIPFSQKILVGCVPISERMRALRCYP